MPKTRDGRVLFAVPWLGKLVLGTTDTPRQDLPREPDAFAEELDFILSEAGHVLSRPVTQADIRSIWVGLRPLVAPPETTEGGTKVLSREHTIVVDANGWSPSRAENGPPTGPWLTMCWTAASPADCCPGALVA
ncbi:Aerobic glycerol-3-phosphate dehydrogenase [Hydrogenophaga sp. T4]|nr:Aerobic glycerol-3-phosphate dehydrogenase [Hydrogenophaga sp. T4]